MRSSPAAELHPPDVFHVGYHRAGSTYLQKGIFPQLGDHLLVAASEIRRIRNCRDDADLDRLYGAVSLQEVGGRIVVDTEEEFSGDMFRDDFDMPAKIHRINPNAKIIVCIRSQIDIIPSLYYLYLKKGGRLSYGAYVDAILKNRKFDYHALVGRYLDLFGPDRVLVCLLEDLAAAPRRFVQSLLDFISLPRDAEDLVVPAAMNRRPSAQSIDTLLVANRLLRTELYDGWGDDRALKAFRRKASVRRVLMELAQLAMRIAGPFGGETEFRYGQHEIRAAYGPRNRRLFDVLGRSINDTLYPGSSFG